MSSDRTPPAGRLDVPDNATWLTPDLVTLADGPRRLAGRLPEGLPLVEGVVRGQLARMFGVPELVGPATPPYRGLLGPRSITGRVIAEPSGIAGGIRGLMVQAAHPRAMAGVTEHSRYRQAPLSRLEGTSAWVTTAAFATVDVAAEQARRVRAMHRSVSGTFEGVPYSADEPRLLVWISVALTSSFLACHQLFAPEVLDADEADRFVAEQARAAALLDPRFPLEDLPVADLPDLPLMSLPLVVDGLPTTRAELASSLASYRDELWVTPAARDAILFLDEVEVPPGVALVYRRFLDAVAATLPLDLRAALGRDRGDRDQQVVRLGRLLAGMRATTGRSPSWHRSREILTD